MAERPSAELVYFADIARKRSAALKGNFPNDSENARTRQHVAAMIVTVFLMAAGWVAVKGLTNIHECSQSDQTVCGSLIGGPITVTPDPQNF